MHGRCRRPHIHGTKDGRGVRTWSVAKDVVRRNERSKGPSIITPSPRPSTSMQPTYWGWVRAR